MVNPTERQYMREMAVTHADFYRILPRALQGYTYTVANNEVVANVADGQVVIRLGEERVRRIALVAIPYCEVHFDYQNLEDTDYLIFREQFELYYRRGGG